MQFPSCNSECSCPFFKKGSLDFPIYVYQHIIYCKTFLLSTSEVLVSVYLSITGEYYLTPYGCVKNYINEFSYFHAEFMIIILVILTIIGPEKSLMSSFSTYHSFNDSEHSYIIKEKQNKWKY